ncbi:hypothetical protein [Clostridium sp. BL-8]|uniref:hypothetical protein n=1 Tax=Clostridium sp. BL-8 TaxID=349938 RepID=UPI00098CD3A9|nr:hypothetical protein [Clostridium sp. BL-8]OOM79881.1 hypothetical protein CLOBL_14150 [Clostridium sp. BL-8]
MQKWEKFLIVNLFILGLLGWLIGFLLAKSGMEEIKILGNIDIFSLIELILLIIVTVCSIFDFHETYNSNIKFCNPEFKVIPYYKNRFKNIFIFLVLLSSSEFVVFIISVDMYILTLFLITLIFTSIFAFHNSLNDYIADNGILYWGIYYTWNDVKSYYISNETLLVINVINNFICFEYNNEIKFTIDNNSKNSITKLITEKLCILAIEKQNAD